jgi:hypothetical protein
LQANSTVLKLHIFLNVYRDENIKKNRSARCLFALQLHAGCTMDQTTFLYPGKPPRRRFHRSGHRCYSWEKGSVYKTTDGGRSWEFISPEKDFNYTSVELISPLDFYVSGFKNLTDGSGITQLFATNDGGQTWQVINSYGEVGEPSQVRCERDNIWFLSGWRGLQKSTDKGKSWELVYKGGGTMVLTDLKTDLSNPESIFVFGTVGGFATYSTMFRHSLNGTPWELPSTFDFDNVSAYTAFDFQNDSIILFRNFYDRFMPNDTSNILSILYDFDRDDLLPGQNTGDTVWHFKIKTVNDRSRIT